MQGDACRQECVPATCKSEHLPLFINQIVTQSAQTKFVPANMVNVLLTFYNRRHSLTQAYQRSTRTEWAKENTDSRSTFLSSTRSVPRNVQDADTAHTPTVPPSPQPDRTSAIRILREATQPQMSVTRLNRERRIQV